MARAPQHDDAVDHPQVDQRSTIPEEHRLALAIGVFNSVCICAVFWILVGLATYLLF